MTPPPRPSLIISSEANLARKNAPLRSVASVGSQKLFADLDRQAWRKDGGVVDQDADAPKTLDGQADYPLPILDTGGIPYLRLRRSPLRFL